MGMATLLLTSAPSPDGTTSRAPTSPPGGRSGRGRSCSRPSSIARGCGSPGKTHDLLITSMLLHTSSCEDSPGCAGPARACRRRRTPPGRAGRTARRRGRFCDAAAAAAAAAAAVPKSRPRPPTLEKKRPLRLRPIGGNSKYKSLAINPLAGQPVDWPRSARPIKKYPNPPPQKKSTYEIKYSKYNSIVYNSKKLTQKVPQREASVLGHVGKFGYFHFFKLYHPLGVVNQKKFFKVTHRVQGEVHAKFG